MNAMGLVYGSVCSGIEAATVAWEPLGWKPVWFSETAAFPKAVLAYHHDVPDLGDMREIRNHDKFRKVDLIVGGTPCQSFSQMGERRGLDETRGDLALEYLRLVGFAEPRWFVWENVPGVLSSRSKKSDVLPEGQNDFGVFLRAIQELGYGFAWRVLDAQYFGVPQRRRRVFIVGKAGGDWRPPFAALFEPESLQGRPEKGGGEREEPRPDAVQGRLDEGGVFGVDIYNYSFTGDVAATLSANSHCTNTHGPKILDSKGVRTLTPNECERLQGFPDGYTDIPGKWKSGDRIKALGNSMAVPVMEWVGRRIQLVDSLCSQIGV